MSAVIEEASLAGVANYMSVTQMAKSTYEEDGLEREIKLVSTPSDF